MKEDLTFGVEMDMRVKLKKELDPAETMNSDLKSNRLVSAKFEFNAN